MIAVIVLIVAIVTYMASGFMAFMFMDSSDFWSTTFWLINRLAIAGVVVALFWVCWTAAGTQLSVQW